MRGDTGGHSSRALLAYFSRKVVSGRHKNLKSKPVNGGGGGGIKYLNCICCFSGMSVLVVTWIFHCHLHR